MKTGFFDSLLRFFNLRAFSVQQQAGKEILTVRTSQGLTITLNDAEDSAEITGIDGSKVSLTSQGISLTSASQITLNAGEVIVNTGMANFSGVVKCDTLIANSVVATSYTTSAGNVG